VWETDKEVEMVLSVKTSRKIIRLLLGAVLLLSSRSAHAELRAAWEFNPPDVSGTSVAASGGTAANTTGILTGDASAGQGFLSLDGDGDYLAFGTDVTGLRGLSAITLCAWIKPGETTNILRRIVEHDDNFYFYQVNNKYAFTIHGVGGASFTSATALELGTWQHFAATWELNQSAKLYINGVLEATVNNPAVAMQNAVQHLSFGAQRNNNATPVQTAFYKGGMDDVAVWDTALTPAHIAALAGVNAGGYAGGYAGRFAPTALTAAPVTALPVTDIGRISATVSGLLNVPAAAVRLYWGAADGGTDPAAWANVCDFGAFASASGLSTNLTGLAAGTRYHYRFYAEDAGGAGEWSAAVYFCTYGTLPDDLPGLQLWLRPDSGVTTNAAGTIESMADQSGNVRDATRSGTAGTLKWAAAGIGTRPAVRFAGGNNNAFLSVPAYTPAAADDLTVFVVARQLPQIAQGTIRPLVSAGPQGSGAGLFCIAGTRPNMNAPETLGCFGRGYSSTVPYSEFAATNDIPNFAPGAGHLAVMTLDAAANAGRGRFAAFFDGITRRTANGANTNPTLGPIEIGGSVTNTGYRFDGYIGDVLIYNRVLSDDERNRIGWYLQSRYGLAGNYADPLVARTAIRAATAVSKTTAVLNGEVLDLPNPVEATFYWGEVDGGTGPAAWAHTNVVGTVAGLGRIAALVTGLTPGATYRFRLRCENASGEVWTAPGSFTAWREEPSDFAGLQLWLRADVGVTTNDAGAVTQWADQSGNVHDAVRVGAAGGITRVFDDWNGLPALATTGVTGSDYLNTPSYQIAAADDLTVFVVARNGVQESIGSAIKALVGSGSAGAGNGTFCISASRSNFANSTGCLGYFGRTYGSNPPYPEFASASDSPNFAPGAGHVAALTLAAAANGGLGQFAGFFDGYARASVAGKTANPQSGPVDIGGSVYNTGTCFAGWLGDILIYDRVLTADERNRVGWHLQTKYGLSGIYRNPFATVLTNAAVDAVTGTSATLAVDVTEGDLPAEVTLHWGETDGVWTASTNLTVHAFGTALLTADGLTPGTIYHARFSAANSQGTVWADGSVSFVTLGSPAIAAGPPNAVAPASATLEGELLADCGAPASVWIYWGAADGGADPGAWEHALPFGVQAPVRVGADVAGLAENTAYFYRLYAQNSYGGRWTDAVRFTTPYTPGNVKPAGLVLWLRADAGVLHSNGLVYAWADQAPDLGGANDAAASGASRPAYLPDALGGRAALRFDGADDFLAVPDHAALGLGTGAGKGWTVLAVYLRENGGTRCIVSKGTAGSNEADWRFFRDDTGLFWGTGISSDTNAWFCIAEPPARQPHILAATLTQTGETSGVKVLYADGEPYFSEPYAAKAPANTMPCVIGGFGAGNGNLNGLIAEVMVFNRALNDDDLNNAGWYLQQKYGIGGLFEYRAPHGTVLLLK
jgi:hypothetical protein